MLAPVPLQTVCVRHEPPASTATRSIATRWPGPIASTDRDAAYLTPAMLDGRWMVRVSIGAEQTEREHVEHLWRILQEAVDGPA